MPRKKNVKTTPQTETKKETSTKKRRPRKTPADVKEDPKKAAKAKPEDSKKAKPEDAKDKPAISYEPKEVHMVGAKKSPWAALWFYAKSHVMVCSGFPMPWWTEKRPNTLESEVNLLSGTLDQIVTLRIQWHMFGNKVTTYLQANVRDGAGKPELLAKAAEPVSAMDTAKAIPVLLKMGEEAGFKISEIKKGVERLDKIRERLDLILMNAQPLISMQKLLRAKQDPYMEIAEEEKESA